jgi:hypothetical protein
MAEVLRDHPRPYFQPGWERAGLTNPGLFEIRIPLTLTLSRGRGNHFGRLGHLPPACVNWLPRFFAIASGRAGLIQAYRTSELPSP